MAGHIVMILVRKWAEGGHTSHGFVALQTEIRRYMTQVEVQARTDLSWPLGPIPR